MSDQEELKSILEQVKEDQEAKALAERREYNVESFRICFPEWEGPILSDGPDGYCTCGDTTCFDEEEGEDRYHYCAPAKIIDILENGYRFRCALAYDESAPEHCREENGRIIILDLSQIWPPVDILMRLRKEAEEREKAE